MSNDLLFSRRRFITRSAQLLSVAATVPMFLDRSAHALAEQCEANPQGSGVGDRILVIIQLAGGNDGLNTIVPYKNDEYYKARPALGVPAKDVLKLNDEYGVHPYAVNLKKLYDAGNLAVVHAVGYPNHNRSHFRGTDIWQSAVPDAVVTRKGWVGGYFDACCSGEDPEKAAKKIEPSAAVALTTDPPQTLMGERFFPMVFRNVESLTRVEAARDENMRAAFDAINGGEQIPEMVESTRGGATKPSQHETAQFLERSALNARVFADRLLKASSGRQSKVTYLDTKMGADLKLVAQMISTGMPTRVFYVSMTGYDTHAGQNPTHPLLIKELADALHSFCEDLKASGHFDRTCIMTFSEFGRRVRDNGSGTDHGKASSMYLLGGGVKGGFHGEMPSLEYPKLIEGDMPHTTDFRRVYASVLNGWLQADDAKILGKKFEPMELFKKT